jgi:Protein of unknown function (DUF2971)
MNSIPREAHEAEMALRFLARANPPPVLFRYRSPNQWTLDEISKQQLYAPKSDELNDPFECHAAVFWDVESIKRLFIEKFAPPYGLSPIEAAKEFDSSFETGMATLLQAVEQSRKNSNIVCFSAIPNSIRMWAYYTKAHEGICIGYDTSVKPFNITLEVKYKNLDNPFDVMAAIKNDPTEIATNITFRKAEEWGFEKEYRIASNLGDIRQIPFHPSAIKEIRLGARINANLGFKEKLLEEISHLPQRPKLIQMGCDFDRFILTETVI